MKSGRQTPQVSQAPERGTAWLFAGLIAYFAAQVIVRVNFGAALELDEADQLALGQWLLFGYGPQPPLYNWLQVGFFQLLGHNLLALSLLKNLILFITYVLVFLAARRLCKRNGPAILAALSLLLIPQIVWESQRDLTQTPLSVALAAATLYAYLVSIDRRDTASYISMGVLIGLGGLAKHNYWLFLGCLGGVCLTTSRGRILLFNRKALITLIVSALLVLPYALWFVTEMDLATHATRKLHQSAEGGWLRGFQSGALAILAYLSPLWLVLLWLFPAGYRRLGRAVIRGNPPYHLDRYFLVLIVAMCALVIALDVTHFKDRWMQPLLFLFPAVFFGHFSSGVDRTRARRFTVVAATAACTALTLLLAHVVAADLIEKHPRRNYPFPALAEQLRSDGFTDGLIVTEDGWVAGNLLLQLPQSQAVAPSFVAPLSRIRPFTDGALLAWDREESESPPNRLLEFAAKVLGQAVGPLQVIELTATYQYSDSWTARLGVVRLPADYEDLPFGR